MFLFQKILSEVISLKFLSPHFVLDSLVFYYFEIDEFDNFGVCKIFNLQPEILSCLLFSDNSLRYGLDLCGVMHFRSWDGNELRSYFISFATYKNKLLVVFLGLGFYFMAYFKQ